MQNVGEALVYGNRVIPMLVRLMDELRTHVGQYVSSARHYDFGMWLLCDGRALDRDRYRLLFDVIGTSFGAPTATTFNLPDFRGRVMGAVGTGDGLTARGMGDRVGTEKHALSVAELPSHVHTGSTGTAGSHSHTGSTGTSGTHAHTTNATGGSLGLAVADGTNTVIDTDNSAGELNVWTTPQALTVDASGSHTHTIASDGAHTHTFTTAATGSNTAHENMQPTLFAGRIFVFTGVKA